MREIKLLSVQQPWAWALIYASKDVENRSWGTSYRGLLAIHASQKFDDDAFDFGGEWAAREWTDCGDQDDYQDDRFKGFDQSKDIRGAIIGVVELWDCVLGSQVQSRWAVADARAWLVRNPVSLPDPISYKGQLGLGALPDGVASLLVQAWEAGQC